MSRITVSTKKRIDEIEERMSEIDDEISDLEREKKWLEEEIEEIVEINSFSQLYAEIKNQLAGFQNTEIEHIENSRFVKCEHIRIVSDECSVVSSIIEDIVENTRFKSEWFLEMGNIVIEIK